MWRLMALCAALSGCALQSSLIDMEENLALIEQHQRAIEGRLNRIEKNVKGIASLEQSSGGIPDLVIRVDGLGTSIQTLTGQVDEGRHLTSNLTKQVEDLRFQTGGLLSKLASLEARLVTVEGREGAIEKPPQGEATVSELTPTAAYNLPYNDYVKGNYDLAISGFLSFIQRYPHSTLISEAVYWIAESFYHKKSYLKAAEFYEKVEKEHPKSEKTLPALLKQGLVYSDMGNLTKARFYLKKVVEQYPNSNEAALAKEKLANLG